MKRSQLAFTLTELMITVAIVSILASIVYPSYRNQVLRSHRVEAKNALLQVQVAQEKFFLQNSRYAGNAACAATELTAASNAGGLGVSATTTNGYYTIVLCSPSTTTYNVTATAAGAQASDSTCKKFIIDNTGAQSSQNSAGSASTGCWK
jgi:type IV pilus assembly protein PilE